MHATRLTVCASLLTRPSATPPRRRGRNPAWFEGAAAAAASALADDAPGAGWFESSAELRRGLAVLEEASFDGWQRACDALAAQGVAATTRPTSVPSSITAIA